MKSLRRRLTMSYTVLVGVFIALVAVVLSWLALDALVQPLKTAIEGYHSEANQIVAVDHTISSTSLVNRMRAFGVRSDVSIRALRYPGVFGFGERRAGGAPGGGPTPGSGPAPGTGPYPGSDGPGSSPPGSGFDQHGPARRPPDGSLFGPLPGSDFAGTGGPLRFQLEETLGLRPQIVRWNNQIVMISANRELLEARVRGFFITLFTALIASFLAAWFIARWIAAQAVEPLIAVTSELRRFAGGDFSPRSVSARNVSDVGELIEAYNGAAAQVAAAFDERARAEQRMRRFLADAGHELRTPLSIVAAYIEVLRKGGVDDPRTRDRAFTTLGSETTRMRRLVERIVALARLEQPETTQPAITDLGVLAADAVAAIEAARGVSVHADIESGAFVLADPADLHEAITNLIDNAVKYGEGTPVRVRVEHEAGAVAVRVSDRGPGIPTADREKIFERFYRGASQQTVEGSGLGLAIATRAAARAGGVLTLEGSGAGETVFTLRVPLHIEAVEMRYTR